jgi:hypothetical protein
MGGWLPPEVMSPDEQTRRGRYGGSRNRLDDQRAQMRKKHSRSQFGDLDALRPQTNDNTPSCRSRKARQRRWQIATR